MKDDREEELLKDLLKDLRTLIIMLKGTDDTYGLLDWVDSYYSDYTEEVWNARAPSECTCGAWDDVIDDGSWN